MNGFLWAMAWKGTATLAAAWLASRLMRRQAAAARHMLWTAAAVAVLLAPLMSVSVPSIEVAVPAGVTFAMTATGAAAGEPASGGAPPVRGGIRSFRHDVGAAAVWVWGLGVLVMLGRMAVAAAAVWRLRRAARPVEGLGEGARVFESEAGMPMTVGLWRPAILLPRGAAEWEPERLRVVVAHETAHIRRGDLVSNLIARLAFCLHWWNPLALVAWREFVRTREMAADDCVLESGASPAAYAGHLLAIARAAMGEQALEPAALPMARRSELEGRLMSILNDGVRRGAPGRAAWAGTAALTLASVAALAAVRPATAVLREMAAPVGMAAPAVAPALAEQPPAKAAELPASLDAGALLERHAEEAFRANRKTEAVALFEQALGVYGEDARAEAVRVKLAILLIGRKEYARADTYLEKARGGEALMWLGVSQERQERNFDAERSLRESSALLPLTEQAGQNAARLLARRLRANGNEAEAKDVENRLAEALAAQRPELLPAPAASGAVYRIGGGVSVPAPLRKVEPGYSQEALTARLSGLVLMAVVIGADGVPFNIQVVRPLGFGLDEKAVEAVRQWRFTPGVKDGQPVNVRANIEVNFRLM